MPRLPCIFEVPQLVSLPSQLALFAERGGIKKLDDIAEESGIYALVLVQSCCIETTYCDFEERAGYSPKL